MVMARRLCWKCTDFSKLFLLLVCRYKEKKSSLVSEVAPIAFRVSELTDRPQAVHQCLSILNMTAIYFVNITQTHEVEPEEVQEIEEMVTSIASWLTGKIEAQKALELHEVM